MKKLRSYSPDRRARKVACTVSAAALMLGITHAATVGLNFPVSYSCCVNNYINYVNAPAFGIPQSGWESLSPTGTGYGGATANLLYLYGINVIDTTMQAPTNTAPQPGGQPAFPNQFLNPLPNGTLLVSWGCPTENWSGFAGYDPGSAAQPNPSHGPGKGEAEVYAGFFRDGINFGPGSSGGDNNQPGWYVDIVGLKTLFTNTPFVIELVASSDSMYALTNAFIVDMTGSTTQSVVYPNPQHYGDAGGSAWFRAIGGGLSTATPTALDTDHVYIYPNTPQHFAGPTKLQSTNNAATLSGIIITDKPVISMSPHQVPVYAGDNVTWSGYAVGVPPLSYQWRRNGVPIPGATSPSYSIASVTTADAGTYDLLVTNLYGSAVSSPVMTDAVLSSTINNLVLDTNPNGPEHDGLNYGATWRATSTDSGSVTRSGVMSFTASPPSQITVAGATNFDSTTGTIMFWMRSTGLGSTNVTPATLFDRLSGTGGNGNGCVVVQDSDGTVEFDAYLAGSGQVGSVASTTSVSDDHWHQIAVVYGQDPSAPPANGSMAIYIDGQPNAAFNGLPAGGWAWQPGQELELGLSHDTGHYQPYSGFMDDVRFYNRALTDAEIASTYSSNALVDTNALVMQLNFTTAPQAGITLTWQLPGAVLQSADTVNGTYTTVTGATSPYTVSVLKAAKFYRYQGVHAPAVVVSNPYLM